MERPYQPDINPYVALIELAGKKKPAALATIIEAEGSTPQIAGASAVFSASGIVCGTIGGGAVEADIEKRARRALGSGRSAVCSFDLAGEPSEETDGICGGRQKILIDARPERSLPVFKKLKTAALGRRPGVMAALIEKDRGAGGDRITRFWIPKNFRAAELHHPSLAAARDTIRAAFREAVPSLTTRSGVRLYLEPHFPPPRLVIAGAGHVGRAVAHLGVLLRFEVAVIDDRPKYANAARFPEADRILIGDVGRTLRDFPVSPDVYIVIVTRGHRHDEEALRACVRSRAGYIGMIGSGRKVRLLREKFIRRGWCTAEEWSRVHTPIGLPIGSKTVEEIAVSIAAELVFVKRKMGGPS